MRARHIILTIAATILLAAPTAVLAQMGPGPGDGSGPGGGWGDGHGPHGGGHGFFGGDAGGSQLRFLERMLPRMAEELGLSDEQVEDIQAIADAARPQIEKYAEQLRAGRDAFREANSDPTVFDEGAFRAHAEAQHKIQTDLMVIVGKTKAEVFKILTPEQREQLQEIRSCVDKRWSRRGHRRRSTS